MDQPNLGHHPKHDPTNVGILSAPHGPETGEDHVHLDGRAPGADETDVLKQLIYPDDSYTPEGVYWADLPLGKQLAFNAHVDNQESKKELASIWAMMKKDPLSPVGWYFRNAVLPGAGLGLEGYARKRFKKSIVADHFQLRALLYRQCHPPLFGRVA